VHYIERKEDLADRLHGIVEPGDIVITMGAGDIYRYGELFVEQVREQVREQNPSTVKIEEETQ
jgi:UDP-N-acetylmuramate--alanine ligase